MHRTRRLAFLLWFFVPKRWPYRYEENDGGHPLWQEPVWLQRLSGPL